MEDTRQDLARGDVPEIPEDILKSNHQFSNDIYRTLAKDASGNLFFSPFSIHTALMLAYVGAKGKTADEIISGLHLPADRNYALKHIGNAIKQLQHPVLKIANAAFIEEKYKIKETYKNEIIEHLHSILQTVDFINSPQAAKQEINGWVSKQTNDKINNLLPEGVVTADTRLVLVNAVHFKAEWKDQFKKERNVEKPFYVTKEKPEQVTMMTTTKNFSYFATDLYRALEIPYKVSGFRMLILLPREIDGLAKLESELPNIDYNEITSKMTNSDRIELYLPKFKLEQCFDLNDALQKLGMKSMFNDADFSGIHEKGEMPLAVSKVMHKAFVDVTEEGTEAAAATAVVMNLRCCRPVMETPIMFHVDHPFIFCILHHSVLLFKGRIVLP